MDAEEILRGGQRDEDNAGAEKGTTYRSWGQSPASHHYREAEPQCSQPRENQGTPCRVPAGHLRSILLSGGACSAHFDAAEAARNHLKIISHLCEGQWQFSLFFFSVGVIVMPSGEKP